VQEAVDRRVASKSLHPLGKVRNPVGDNPALSIARVPSERTAVLARPYHREEAPARGVIVSRYCDGE
jgi:hypothetical protein